MINLLILLIEWVAFAYFWVVIARVLMSWLIGFNILNQFNPGVRELQRITYMLTEPLLGPIRRFMPDLGGLDISPIVLLFGIEAVRLVVVGILAGTFFR